MQRKARRDGWTSKKLHIQKWTTFSWRPPTGRGIGRDSRSRRRRSAEEERRATGGGQVEGNSEVVGWICRPHGGFDKLESVVSFGDDPRASHTPHPSQAETTSQTQQTRRRRFWGVIHTSFIISSQEYLSESFLCSILTLQLVAVC